MGQEQYDKLENMHGLVRISFDQSALKFPFFLKKMQEGSWETLAPVLKGEEYYTIPHVRMAWDHGVKIKLFDCEYTADTMEPYQAYMDHFAKMKNEADATKTWAKEELKKCKDQASVDLKKVVQKADFDRTVVKCFLNGLLGAQQHEDRATPKPS